MATTEVHRTLVKSPPELWAELSDRDALARHLSDFGEIRITSTVAENAVHWETDEATGSALIRQAGWGTKVTLRATVRAAEQEPEREATPVLATAQPVPPPSPGAPGPLTAAAMRDPVETSTPSAWAAATGSGAAVEASPPPAREPAFVFASPQASEPDLARDDLAHEAPAFEDAETPPSDTREDGDPEPTRRGFFARLFGRRPRRSEEHDQAPARPADLDEPPTEAAPAPEPAEPTALEALQARFAARPQVPETPSVPADPVVEEPAPTPSEAAPDPPAAEGLSPDPTAAEDLSPDPTEGGDSPEHTAAAAVLPDPIAAADVDADLSSELRHAEETGSGDVRTAPTEDQVKEILTGVLDRLGAAHHRPFSRA